MPSALDTLIGRISDEQLRSDIRAAVADLRKVTDFGLVFETHIPETIRLPHYSIRRGIKVTLRDLTDQSMFEVLSVSTTTATIRRLRHADGSALSLQETAEVEKEELPLSSIVALADFGDAIYPGMQHQGSVHRGGDKAAHIVIKGENYLVLEALRFSHAGKVDCIYIDPPYNTRDKDWKYNNDYVDSDDVYKHSKWLAMMQRRLLLAKELLNQENSVLIVTIDEKEYLRLGLLLEQTFAEARIQMITSVIKAEGTSRQDEFSRTNEFIYFVRLGSSAIHSEVDDEEEQEIPWRTLRRTDFESRRGTTKGGPAQFYPIYVDREALKINHVGQPLLHGNHRDSVPEIPRCDAVLPIRPDGTEMNWSLTRESLMARLQDGYVRVGTHEPDAPQTYVISYLKSGAVRDIEAGVATVVGKNDDGSVRAVYRSGKERMPTTVWRRVAHDAQRGGTGVLRSLLPDRRFPFPKSLYAVEDALRFFIGDNPKAVVLDFFAGSGTTAHAVMRLNKQDGGERQCLLVTNNEVSAEEQRQLRDRGLRPGDPEWEALGICNHITKPRIEAAVTGLTPDGQPIAGDYKFGEEFPMAQGLEENIEFFELTYLDAAHIEVDMAFAEIAPLLWLRAGARGSILDESLDAAGRRKPYAWTKQYGVLFNTDRWRSFVSKLPDTATTVYIVTDSITVFSHIAGELPGHLDVVRLYERYLTTFSVNGR